MANASKYYTIGTPGKADAVIEPMSRKAECEPGELCNVRAPQR